MAKRGRKPGPVLLCDLWIEEQASQMHSNWGVPLKTAVQYAVDDLRRYIASEKHARMRYSTDLQYEEHMRDIRVMEATLGQDDVEAVRATKRKDARKEAGMEALDLSYSPSYLLGPPDTASESPTVKRNYERMANKSR